MDFDRITKFKGLFEAQKRDLLYSHGILDESFHPTQEELSDDVDLACFELEASMRLRLRNREALLLKKIDDALHRIAEGSFGYCESCKDPIDERRLEARPMTTLCLRCKEDQERNERLHIDGMRPKSLGRRLRLA